MTVIVSIVLIFAILQGKIQWSNAMATKVANNVDCIPGGGSSTDHVLEYKKLEVVNNFDTGSLKDLLSRGGIMPEDNPHYNQFIHCVWKNRGLLSVNDDIDYDLLENFIKHAIVSAVGTTGPAINLSMVQARKITKECKSIKGLNPGQRIAKVQNFVVTKLQPFAQI